MRKEGSNHQQMVPEMLSSRLIATAVLTTLVTLAKFCPSLEVNHKQLSSGLPGHFQPCSQGVLTANRHTLTCAVCEFSAVSPTEGKPQ